MIATYLPADDFPSGHAGSLELVIKELQGVLQSTTLAADKTNEELGKERAVKAELLGMNSQLQTQLDSLSSEMDNLRKELAEVKEHAHEPTPEAIEEIGQLYALTLI